MRRWRNAGVAGPGREVLHRSGNREFAIVKMLPPGVYQYKFIVDGEWKYAPAGPCTSPLFSSTLAVFHP